MPVLPLLALLLVTGAANGADQIVVEGEDYESYGYNDLGGVAIGAEWCSGASGFLAAGGLDVPGEWIRLKVTFTVDACYESEVAYQSAYGDTVELRVRLLEAPAPGGQLLDDYMLTDGWGFG